METYRASGFGSLCSTKRALSAYLGGRAIQTTGGWRFMRLDRRPGLAIWRLCCTSGLGWQTFDRLKNTKRAYRTCQDSRYVDIERYSHYRPEATETASSTTWFRSTRHCCKTCVSC